ncbi:MAG: hypothetical protein WC766_04345 [Patescibacteria group bacterium]|jgi:hypothetical protein
MEKSLSEIAKATSSSDRNMSWEDWLAGLEKTRGPLFIAYLQTIFDFEWQAKAVNWLLDLLEEKDVSGYCIEIPGKLNPQYGPPWSVTGCHLVAAELLIFKYLNCEPYDNRYPELINWAEDFVQQPALFGRVLSVLLLHKPDSFFDRNDMHPQSSVKKFLKRCWQAGDFMKAQGDDFRGVVAQHRVVYFEALIAFGLSDWIHECSDEILEALRSIVFARSIPGEIMVKPFGNLQQALGDDCSGIRQSAAERLVVLQEKKRSRGTMGKMDMK